MAENKKVKAKVVEVPTEAPKVGPKLVVTTIIYLIAIVNAAAASLGFNFNIDADYEFIYQGVSLVFMVGSFIHAYWKNNDVTKKARIKAEVSKQIKVD
ncbi:holin [Bacillus phage SIOphi]|uniref:Holin n=2 Tax=root TaxID=1 RepID=R4JGQ2_9CAUD|nr:holin [Bacillus phage SIOphi]OLF87174.1 hypothetical protein B4089_3644 [Bacillus licheniformis]QXN69986.1 putative holin [Bacillus phage vB_BspH_Mawwa]QXN70799.1 putative holin protein [Bacillus phage vB_BspH_TimeGriffin]AGK86966.1 hypothetical protein SIOphi_00790 [Bacillus phage SIOphi]OLF87225.1 hypothetical protein B4089_3695 [Bacillus licheniformis]